MEICVISDAVLSIAFSGQCLGFGNILINRLENVSSVSDASTDQAPQSLPQFRMAGASFPPTKTLTRRRLRKLRRVKGKTLDGDDGEDSELYFFSGGGGGIGNGYHGHGGGGKGWNFGVNGGQNWGDFGDNSLYDPAFDFVYMVLCWIAMSNCLHFSFRKVLRFAADSLIDRGKVSMPLTQVC